ncbi:serine protease 23-like [Halichondria panicea]|uniref:serine protease 23-like n=1 Tax=Halichondria panicea TaxID=6063 RepID=UPI00312B662E
MTSLVYHILLALIPSMVLSLPMLNSNQTDSYNLKLAWETYWVNSGKIDSEEVILSLPQWTLTQSNKLLHSSRLTRHKRVVFGDDDRVRIDPATDGEKFPYTAIMRVSTGCSGIMVSKSHILTAAHCVHDGQQYRQSALFFLRAGYLQPDGTTKWGYVKRFFVPSGWKDLSESKQHVNKDWDDYDVAILELATDMGDERDFIAPGLSGMFCDGKVITHGADSKVEYVSFPDDKETNAYWYVQTKIDTESPHLIYFRGDAWHGSSGAGLYTWDYNEESKKYERRVVGVLSGNRDAEPIASVQGNFNVAARLNPANFLLVCQWIGAEDKCKERYKKYLDNDSSKTLCS